MSTLDNPASADPVKIARFLRGERLRVIGQTGHDHDKRYAFDEAAIYVAWASDEIADLLKHRSAIAELNERFRVAIAGIEDDFMTSERHHPGYVLIPTEKFEALRAAASAGIQKAEPK